MDLKNFLIEKCYIFQDKSPEELEILLERTRPVIKELQKGEKISSQGDKAGYLGIVIRGSVAVKKSFSTGKVVTLATFGKGQAFGESVLFSADPCYPADIIAQEETKVFRLSREDLLFLLKSDREILLRFMETISNRVLMLSNKIELLSLGTIKQKIAYYLLRQAAREGKDRFRWEFSRNELADYFNIPRPSLSRELARMKKEGLIGFNRREVEIKKPEELEEILLD